MCNAKRKANVQEMAKSHCCLVTFNVLINAFCLHVMLENNLDVGKRYSKQAPNATKILISHATTKHCNLKAAATTIFGFGKHWLPTISICCSGPIYSTPKYNRKNPNII